MNLAAIVIWYNPIEIGEEKIINNINSYLSYVKKIYIIDNSENDNSKLASKIQNSEYFFNKNVGGIAGALNLGCKKAYNEGFEWVLTMDQDSIWIDSEIKNYIKLVTNYLDKDEKAVSFGPLTKNLNAPVFLSRLIRNKFLSPLKRKFLGKRFIEIPSFEHVNTLITSGNIIKLSAWNEVGGFDQLLFIDCVDDDICIKFKKHGYKIIQFNSVCLNHFIGEKTYSIFKKTFGIYSDFRLFYIFRNNLIQKYRYPEYEEFYNRRLKAFFGDNCVNSLHPIRHLKVFFRASKAYKILLKQESIKRYTIDG